MVHLLGLGQNVINSRSGGKISARNELLNAPTSDMKRSSLGMAAANPTTYENKDIVSVIKCFGNSKPVINYWLIQKKKKKKYQLSKSGCQIMKSNQTI